MEKETCVLTSETKKTVFIVQGPFEAEYEDEEEKNCDWYRVLYGEIAADDGDDGDEKSVIPNPNQFIVTSKVVEGEIEFNV